MLSGLTIEHDFDPTMFPRVPLRNENYLAEIDNDSDGGVYGNMCILVCRYGHVLLYSSVYRAMLVQDAIKNKDTFMCEPLWHRLQLSSTTLLYIPIITVDHLSTVVTQVISWLFGYRKH
jgi:hypothetical protein